MTEDVIEKNQDRLRSYLHYIIISSRSELGESVPQVFRKLLESDDKRGKQFLVKLLNSLDTGIGEITIESGLTNKHHVALVRNSRVYNTFIKALDANVNKARELLIGI